MELDCISWAALRKTPTWTDIEAVMKRLSKQNLYDANDTNAKQLHKEFGFVKNYCGEAKIKQWNADKVEVSTRWVEIFQHLDSESCDYEEITKIAEFVLCLPGSTASVERVFSNVNDTWTEEKTRLKVETLKAMISVKVNSKMSCLEFYGFVKTQPEMLRKVASKEKYTVRTEQATEQIDDDSDSDIKL